MKPPKRSGAPRSFSTRPRRRGAEDARSERVDNLRQDAIATAALSPDEAQQLANSLGGEAAVDASISSPARAKQKQRTDSGRGRGPAPTKSSALTRADRAELPREWVEDTRDATDPQDFDEVISQPVHLSDRRREKIAERRRLRIKRLVVLFSVVLAILLVVWVLFFSSLLALRKDRITVSGLGAEQTLTTAQIADAMAPWVGVPVLRLNGGAVEEDLVAAYPLIKSVEVSRKLPRGVALDVSLREPVACLMKGEACSAIDADGVALDLPAEQTATLPRLVLDPGQDQTGDAAQTMIEVLKAVPQATRERVASIEVSDAAQVTLTLSDGAVVVWGGSQDNEFKAQVLEILLQQPATRYDVSAPRAPVTS